jgi:type VI protein secretion system component VasF
MKDEDKTKEGRSSPGGASNDVTPHGDAVEPWQPIETKLVIWSVVGGMVALIVLAILVHMFLLGGH